MLQEEMEQHHKTCQDKKVVLEMAMMNRQEDDDDVPLWKRTNHTEKPAQSK